MASKCLSGIHMTIIKQGQTIGKRPKKDGQTFLKTFTWTFNNVKMYHTETNHLNKD